MCKRKVVVTCDSFFCGIVFHVYVEDDYQGVSLYYDRKKGEKFYCDTCKRDRAIESILNKKWWRW
jgi:hypothetical protein